MIKIFISRKTEIKLDDQSQSQKQIINDMCYVRHRCWNKLIEYFNPIICNNLDNKIHPLIPSNAVLLNFIKEYGKKSDFPKVNNRVYKTCVDDYVDAWWRYLKKAVKRKPKFHKFNYMTQKIHLSSLQDRLSVKEDNTLILPHIAKGKKADKTITFYENLTKYANCKVMDFSILKRNNKYFISLTFEINEEKIESKENSLGLDWGLKNLFTDSNGKTYDLPKRLIRIECKINYLNKLLTKKRVNNVNYKSSKNYNKLRSKFNDAWLRYDNIKKDYIEKLTTNLMKENSLIALETLDITDMIKKGHRFRRRIIHQHCFNQILTRLKQKEERFTCKVVQVDQYFASSKTCCKCGLKHDMPLNKRRMICPCGNNIDRDHNAAINILKEGTRVLSNLNVTTAAANAVGISKGI